MPANGSAFGATNQQAFCSAHWQAQSATQRSAVCTAHGSTHYAALQPSFVSTQWLPNWSTLGSS